MEYSVGALSTNHLNIRILQFKIFDDAAKPRHQKSGSLFYGAALSF
jgi:hypothetical protein